MRLFPYSPYKVCIEPAGHRKTCRRDRTSGHSVTSAELALDEASFARHHNKAGYITIHAEGQMARYRYEAPATGHASVTYESTKSGKRRR